MSNRADDLKAMRQVRSVLVKHWIDLGRLSLRCTSGVLQIRGSLMRLAGMKDPLTSAIVQTIFTDIKRVREIKRIQPDLSNWNDHGGGWTETGSGSESGPSTSSGGSGTTINIKS